MKIEQTTLPFLQADCIQEFGPQAGKTIFEQTQALYQQLLQNADYRNNAAIQEHLQKKLFPSMAYYKVLRENGMDEAEALTYVRKETHKAAEIKKQEMSQMAKLPFAYTIYRMGVKKYMQKNFPEEGWTTEWVTCSSKEIHFNLSRCIYWDLSQQYGCPELCTVYCENDDISFSGLLPKIRFERAGTVSAGANCCDFHFLPT